MGPGNHPDELYTVFGPKERVETLEFQAVVFLQFYTISFHIIPLCPRIVDRDDWIAKHGEAALCRIPGWSPSSVLV